MVKKESYGAVLYCRNPNSRELGVILGYEMNGWYPFKGGAEEGETPEMAAIREIYEETAGVVQLKEISLPCCFATKSKKYRIGLAEVSYSVLEEFQKARSCYYRGPFAEKSQINWFPIDEKTLATLPTITQKCLEFFKEQLSLSYCK